MSGARGEYIRLVRRLVALGMVRVTSARPVAVNSVFTVSKDADSDRLIIDAQLGNSFVAECPAVTLPNPAHLAALKVPEGYTLMVCKSDLADFYHQLAIPHWMQTYLGLPPLTAAELGLPPGSLDGLSTHDGLVYPLCCTLPMGFSHSVFIAQCVHEFILYGGRCPRMLSLSGFTASATATVATAAAAAAASPRLTHCGSVPAGADQHDAWLEPVLEPTDNIINIAVPSLAGRVLHLIYIDDLSLVCVVPTGAAGITSAAASAVRALFDLVLRRYEAVGLPAKMKKVVFPTTGPVIVLGVEFFQHLVRPPAAKLLEVCLATQACLSAGVSTGRQLSQLVGCWTWFMLLRRPALTVLRGVYKFIRVADDAPFVLWPSVRFELAMLLFLAPLLRADLSVPFHSQLLATDASELGGGVVSTPLQPQLLNRIWPLSARQFQAINSEAECWAIPHLPSLASFGPMAVLGAARGAQAVRQAVYQPALSYLPAANVPPAFAAVLQRCPWATLISHRWRWAEHVNVLEARAALLAVRRLLSSPLSSSSTLVCLLDSTAVFYALRKGRSSSRLLTPPLNAIAALLLAANASILPAWVSTTWNPADKPSRLQRGPPWPRVHRSERR